MSPVNGADFCDRGQLFSGRLANRLGSRFGTNTELLRGVNWPYLYAAVFDEFSPREGCRNNALPRWFFVISVESVEVNKTLPHLLTGLLAQSCAIEDLDVTHIQLYLAKGNAMNAYLYVEWLTVVSFFPFFKLLDQTELCKKLCTNLCQVSTKVKS